MSLHSSLLEMVIGAPKKYTLEQNTDVIHVFAEMAYNDVVFDSFLEHETFVTEGFADTFKEKVKKIFDAVIGFIKSVWNKVVGFIKDLAKKIKGEKSSSSSSSNSSTSTGSSSSSSTSSENSSGSSSEEKKEPKMTFHDWKKITMDFDQKLPNPEDILDIFDTGDLKKIADEKELENYKNLVEKRFSTTVYKNYTISEIDKIINEFYEELVSKNVITSPLPAKELEELLNRVTDAVDNIDEANKEFSKEMKEAEEMFKVFTIENLAKVTGETYSEKEAELMMDAAKYTASKLKDVSTIMGKLFIKSKRVVVDIIKNIEKELKYAK